MADNEAEMLDLDQFQDLDDALDQLANSRVYDDVLKEAFARPHVYSLLTVFAQSACTRFRGLHEGIVREIAASNPHAAFPLNRAFAETVLTVAYAHDHPDYIERITERRGDQPKELKRLQIKNAHRSRGTRCAGLQPRLRRAVRDHPLRLARALATARR